MSRSTLRLAIILTLTIMLLSLMSSNPAGAQLLPPIGKAARVQITRGPELEIASTYLTIITWTTSNPGGTDEHFGVVRYGTDPKHLSATAKNPIRLNRTHSYTVFRVRMSGLKPKTTYYYKVTSMESNGNGDGEESAVRQFTTPGPGEVIAASPPH